MVYDANGLFTNIQKFILFNAYALSPLLIGFMAIGPLRDIGSRYLVHIVGMLLCRSAGPDCPPG